MKRARRSTLPWFLNAEASALLCHPKWLCNNTIINARGQKRKDKERLNHDMVWTRPMSYSSERETPIYGGGGLNRRQARVSAAGRSTTPRMQHHHTLRRPGRRRPITATMTLVHATAAYLLPPYLLPLLLKQ